MNRLLKEDDKISAVHAYKNLVVIAVGFLLLFSAFSSLQNLLSSLYPQNGFLSLCLIYVVFMISCLIMPSLVIQKTGWKYALVLSMIGYSVYTISNLYPILPILVMGALISGLTGGPLWAAQGSYITCIAMMYAKSAGLKHETVVQIFFSIFFVIYQFNHLGGNLLASLVLKGKDTIIGNVTLTLEKMCGASYCPVETTATVSSEVEASSVTMLVIIYIGFSVAAALSVFFFLDRIQQKENKKHATLVGSITSTCSLFKDPRMCLLIPISIFYGLQQGFVFGDFTKGYISCSLGIENVGFVMICFGVVGGISCLALGVIVKWVGTLILMTFGFTLHAGLILWFLFWDANPDKRIIFYITSGLWGICHSIWSVETSALCGIYFPDFKEAAFSQNKLWLAVGYVISFSYGNHLCTDMKIYILLGFLVVGILFYFVAEILHRRSVKSLQLETEMNDLNNVVENKHVITEGA